MLSHYSTLHARSLFSSLKQVISLSLFLFTGQLAFAQNEQEIAQLLQSRNEQITLQQNTREIDQQLYLLGHLPKAVITSQLLENGQLRIEFPTYQPIPDAKKTRIEERLGQHYASYLLSISVNKQQQLVTIIVPASTTSEQLDAIFDHFGYLGHE